MIQFSNIYSPKFTSHQGLTFSSDSLVGIHPIPSDIHPEQIRPWVFDQNNQPVLAQITQLQANDAVEIERWFHPETGKPGYTDEKYHQWWVNLALNNGQIEADTKTYALRKEGQILGVLFLEERQLDHFDNEITTLIRGVRVAPDMNASLNPNAKYKGVGKALLIKAISESAKLETSGIGLTSSHGVEEYYESLLGKPVMSRQHQDDPIGVYRQYYVLKGEARNKQLRYLQAQSHRLHSQWKRAQEKTPLNIHLAFQGYLQLQ